MISEIEQIRTLQSTLIFFCKGKIEVVTVANGGQQNQIEAETEELF